VIGGGLSSEASVVGTNMPSVIGLRVVLPTGEILDTNGRGTNIHRASASIVDGDGPILTPIFLGDGGVLGVKVQATLQLRPPASRHAAREWEFASFDAVWVVLTRLRASREVPYSSIRVSQANGSWLFSCVCKANDQATLRSRMRQLDKVLASSAGRSVGHSGPWKIREGRRELTKAPAHHELPRVVVAGIFGNAEFPEAFARVLTLLTEKVRTKRLRSLGIAEPLVAFRPHSRRAMYTSMSLTYDPTVPTGRTAAAKLAAQGYRLINQLGGHLEPLQGEASRIVAEGWSDEYRAIILGLKRLVDPKGILNPGLWGLKY